MGSMESSSRSKDKAGLQCCQASGREVRIIHHRESLYQAGDTAAMYNLGLLLAKRGESAEAEAWYHRAAEASLPDSYLEAKRETPARSGSPER